MPCSRGDAVLEASGSAEQTGEVGWRYARSTPVAGGEILALVRFRRKGLASPVAGGLGLPPGLCPDVLSPDAQNQPRVRGAGRRGV
jgi:hypothetical protein